MHKLGWPTLTAFTIAVLAQLYGISTANAETWTTHRAVDSFTDLETCRATLDKRFVASIGPPFVISYTFFVERSDKAVRTGFFVTQMIWGKLSPSFPFPGDVQIRVNNHPAVTITAADTPLDLASPIAGLPNMQSDNPPEYGPSGANTRGALLGVSPYRALSGGRASALLQDMVSADTIKWRLVGIMPDYNLTDEIPTAGLRDALAGCRIAF